MVGTPTGNQSSIYQGCSISQSINVLCIVTTSTLALWHHKKLDVTQLRNAGPGVRRGTDWTMSQRLRSNVNLKQIWRVFRLVFANAVLMNRTFLLPLLFPVSLTFFLFFVSILWWYIMNVGVLIRLLWFRPLVYFCYF